MNFLVTCNSCGVEADENHFADYHWGAYVYSEKSPVQLYILGDEVTHMTIPLSVAMDLWRDSEEKKWSEHIRSMGVGVVWNGF